MNCAVTFSLNESPEDEVEVRRPGLRDRGQRSSQQPEDLPAPGGTDAQAETQAVARQTRPDLAPNLTTLDYTNTALHCTAQFSLLLEEPDTSFRYFCPSYYQESN